MKLHRKQVMNKLHLKNTIHIHRHINLIDQDNEHKIHLKEKKLLKSLIFEEKKEEKKLLNLKQETKVNWKESSVEIRELPQ